MCRNNKGQPVYDGKCDQFLGGLSHLADLTQDDLEVEVSLWNENRPIREKMNTLVQGGKVSLGDVF